MISPKISIQLENVVENPVYSLARHLESCLFMVTGPISCFFISVFLELLSFKNMRFLAVFRYEFLKLRWSRVRRTKANEEITRRLPGMATSAFQKILRQMERRKRLGYLTKTNTARGRARHPITQGLKNL